MDLPVARLREPAVVPWPLPNLVARCPLSLPPTSVFLLRAVTHRVRMRHTANER